MILPELPSVPSLPTLEISPVPEHIFLGTVKGLLSFVINLSLLDTSLIITIILLIHANPSTRQKVVLFLSFLLLVFGLGVSLVNVYTLVRHFLYLRTEVDGWD